MVYNTRDTKAALVRTPELEPGVLDLCRRYPDFLGNRAAMITANRESLRRATDQRPEWRLGWRRWPQQPSALYNVLTRPILRMMDGHQRLHFLTDSQEGHKVPVRSPKSAFSWLKMENNSFDSCALAISGG